MEILPSTLTLGTGREEDLGMVLPVAGLECCEAGACCGGFGLCGWEWQL